MYLRIQLTKKDRRYVRFLWRNLDTKRMPDIYEFNRVVFGLTSSPFLAQYVPQMHAQMNCKEYARAAESILKSTYTDDRMDSVATEKEGICLCNDLTQLWNLATMQARKWSSNLKTLMQKILVEDRPLSVSLNADAELCVKTLLGLWWTAETDEFVYKVHINDFKVITKRCKLSKIAKNGYLSSINCISLPFRDFWVLKIATRILNFMYLWMPPQTLMERFVMCDM